jgi:hypothetical protein
VIIRAAVKGRRVVEKRRPAENYVGMRYKSRNPDFLRLLDIEEIICP